MTSRHGVPHVTEHPFVKWRASLCEHLLSEQPVIHTLDQYETLINEWLPRLIYDYAGLDTTYEEKGVRHQYVVEVSNYRYVRHLFTPDEAHLRNMNYAIDLMVDLHMRVYRLPPKLDKVVHPVDLSDPEPPERHAVSDVKKKGRKRKVIPVYNMRREIEDEIAAKQRDQQERTLVHEEVVSDHIFCSFPNMLQSTGCILSDGCGMRTRIQNEMGGSFIQRGKRRFIPFVERLRYNEPFFFKVTGYYTCQIRSEHLDRKHRSTSTLTMFMSEHKRGKDVGSGNLLDIGMPFLVPHVPIHVLVLAMGFTFEEFEEAVYRMDSDSEQMRSIISPYLHRMRHIHYHCHTADDALMYIGTLYKRYDTNVEKLKRSIRNTIHSEVFPHLNTPDPMTTNRSKLMYLAWLSGLLFRFSHGMFPETDRDGYQHISLDGAGELLAQLFRMLLTAFTKHSIKTIRRTLKVKVKVPKRGALPVESKREVIPSYGNLQLAKVYNANRLTPKLMSAISTGRWTEAKDGVSHPLKSANSEAIRAQLRRVSSSYLHNQGKHVEPRMVHETSYGYMCPPETPDSASCGLVYTLAQTCVVTVESNSEALTLLVVDLLREYLVPLSMTVTALTTWGKLIGPLGNILGWITDIEACAKLLRAYRRKGLIDPHTSIYSSVEKRSLTVHASAGRPTRPLLVMSNIHKVVGLLRKHGGQMQSLLAVFITEGVIEYLDAAEAYSGPHAVCVAFGPHVVDDFHTHMELSDFAFVGICASTLPYFRHNQGPRTGYQIGMSKQFMSPQANDDYGANTSHLLHHGQHPLVTTIREEPEACNGLNMVVALVPHPRCQEDAIAIKREAIDRGVFHSTSIRTHTATHTPRNVNQDQDQFERPDPSRTFGMKLADYDKIDSDGVPRPGTIMQFGDVVIGKTIPHTHISASAKVKAPDEFRDPAFLNNRRDASIQIRKDEAGIVHQTIVAQNIRKVRVRSYKKPAIGDKVSNRHGQKGALGVVIPSEDMPFSPTTGMIPDILIGPTSLPSRMTMGMVLEMFVSKTVALTGDVSLGIDRQECDAAFTEASMTRLMEILGKLGFERCGGEMLHDGTTGELLECMIMMGPIFYGKLDHMVCKKVHARARGPVQPLTRQPIEGRRNDGGFRLGPMEIDSLASRGVAEIIRERTTVVSDEIKMYRCKQCGFAGDANPAIGMYMCRFCKTSKHMRTLRQSNSSSVMFTELACSGISTRFMLEDDPHM